MKETVMVTVIMLTYNHEKWIAKALDGVVQQKTNFKLNCLFMMIVQLIILRRL